MLLLFFLACASLDPLPTEPVKVQDVPVQAAEDLGLVLDIARVCIQRADPKRVLMAHELVVPVKDGLWEVSIRDESQEAHTVVVDSAGRRCGEGPVVDVPNRALGSLPELFEQAWTCGQTLGGTGVGGTPLVREGMSLHSKSGKQVTFSIAEADAHTIPRGRDLSVSKECTGLPMD